MSKTKAAAENVEFDEFEKPADFVYGGFHPENWYWQVKADLGFVWSSARRARVPIDDATFKQWFAEGRGLVTRIGAFEDLRDVWATYGIFLDPAAQYRDIRAERYIKELGKVKEGEQPTFEKTIGDVVDTLIAQVAQLAAFVDVLQNYVNGPRGVVATEEFSALVAKIETIKTEVPKPAVDTAPAAEEVKDGK